MIILDKQKQAGGVTQTIGYEESGDKLIIAPVSYTHLTLPTNREV